jgi:hypothetical protein
MNDRLDKVFALRKEFMELINEKYPGAYPEWPVDLSEKTSQQAVREFAFRGMEELFEALLHLRNWKNHRNGTGDFNHDEFLEEMIDAYNYFTAVLILVGVDSKDFYDAFLKKHEIICSRLK